MAASGVFNWLVPAHFAEAGVFASGEAARLARLAAGLMSAVAELCCNGILRIKSMTME